MPRMSDDIGKGRTWKGLASLAMFVILGICMGLMSELCVSALQTGLIELPILFPVQSADVAAYFGEIARQNDIAASSPEYLGFIAAAESPKGQTMVVYRSWADAERELEALSDQVDWVMYNPENWELTPSDEKQDLGAVVQRAADLTHSYGLRFMFAPDRRFAERYLVQVAPSIDAVLLQGQRLQQDPQAFSGWVLGMVDVAREANPDMLVYVQVGATIGPAIEMYAAIQTVADQIDGISIWSMPRSQSVLEEFVHFLREDPPIGDVTSVPTSTTLAVVSKTPTSSPTLTLPVGESTATRSPGSPTPVPTPTSTIDPGNGNLAQQTPVVSVTPADSPAALLAERNARTRRVLEGIGLAVGGAAVGLLAGYWFFQRRKGTPL